MEFPDGLYDLVITQSLRDALSRSTAESERAVQFLSAEDAPERLVAVERCAQVSCAPRLVLVFAWG